MSVTTKEATECLYGLAQRTPFNIAPERAEELASEIFGSGKWSINPSEGVANFYAIPADAAICLSYAGLASLWCLAYAAFHLMDIASRRQRCEKAEEQTHIDIGEYCAALQLGEYVAYSRSLFHSDFIWPRNLSKPNGAAPLNSNDGRVIPRSRENPKIFRIYDTEVVCH